MKASLAREFNRLLLLVVVAGIAALSFNSLWPIVLALGAYIFWSTRQLFGLYEWLTREQHEEPPDSSGLWGELYTRLEHLFRQEKRARNDLHTIIERAQSSVNALTDGVILIDQDGRLEYFNTAAERLLGFSRSKDTGQPLTNLMRDPLFTDYLRRGKFLQPIEFPAPKDDSRTLQCLVTEFGQGEQLILVRDITRLHNLEQMRKDFVANVSHELKTPLTVLKGYLETLLDSVDDDQRALRRALEQMNQQSCRMEALVHDLLLLSRLENTASDNTHHAVALQPMLERMKEDAISLAAGRGHRVMLEVAPDARISGNASELESAFGNLITNAVKYTPDNGDIQIRWWQDEGGAYFSVSDNGIGIDARHIPRLTERFYRPDTSRVTQTGGTGLGLAIVKHVMLRHGGRLEIRSQLGKGSTFTCHFPPARLVGGPAAATGGEAL